MLHRLSLKLIVALTVIVTVVSMGYALVHIRSQRERLLETMILGADQLSKSITSATWHSMLADHRTSAYQTMQTIAEKQGMDCIRMFNREGTLMYSTRAAENGSVAGKSDGVCAPCHSGGGQATRTNLSVASRVRIVERPDGRRTLSMVTPIYNEPACSQAACHAHPASYKVLGVVDVALRLDPVDQEAVAIRNQVILMTLAQVVVISLFVVAFVRFFVDVPIGELIEGTKAMSAMELDKPIEIRHRSQEMDALADSFNLMRERLRGAVTELNRFAQELETKVAQRTEQLKVAHQKLLHSDRLASLGQLSASVAHEINNPIAGVLNLSMLMQRILKDDGIPERRIPEFRRYLGQVVAETGRVGRIVADLLAFSRRSKPQWTSTDLNKLIRTTVGLAAHKLKLADTNAEFDLQPDLPPIVCDPAQIQQVVLNLVLNAAEATQGRFGATVRILTRLNAEGTGVEMTVEDNGEGIPPQNLQKIFDPFFTTKPEGKGVGLGLAVLYGIIRAHEGDVEVASEVGRGTKFLVSLPLKPAGHAPAAEPSNHVDARK